MQEKSLFDLIEKIKWQSLRRYENRISKVLPDSVAFAAGKSSKKNPVINRMTIRVGDNVRDKLGWTALDKIMILQDPDDLLTFLLVKSDRDSGNKFVKEKGKSTVHRIVFTWKDTLYKEAFPLTDVEYEVYKKQLILKAPRK